MKNNIIPHLFIKNKIANISKVRFLNLCILLFLTGISTLFYIKFQQKILAGGGKGWDGIHYFNLYQHFAGNAITTTIDYPFCKRIGLPYLASFLPFSASENFLLLNISSGILTIFLTFFALKSRFSSFVSMLTTLPLIFYLFSPLRISVYYPFTIDPPAMAMYALSIVFLAQKYTATLITLLLSCFFKESGLYFAYALCFLMLINRKITLPKFFFSVIGMTVFAYILQKLAYPPCQGSQLKSSIYWTYYHLTSFGGMVRTVAAFSLTLGAFLLASDKKRYVSYCSVTRTSYVFLGLALIMGVCGGSDTTRIFYINYPLYSIALATLIMTSNKYKVIALSFAGLIANSFLSQIPEPENYIPKDEIHGFFSLFPDHAHIAIGAAIIVFWLIAKYVTTWLIRYLPSGNYNQ